MWHRRVPRPRTPLAVIRAAACACRDLTGRRARLAVGLTRTQLITLTLPAGETVVLTPAEVGRLRHELRSAAIEAVVGPALIEDALAHVKAHNEGQASRA